MEIAYHASHEQFPPSKLLSYAIQAEKAGFDAIHSSDHFHPWSKRQGNSRGKIIDQVKMDKSPSNVACHENYFYVTARDHVYWSGL